MRSYLTTHLTIALHACLIALVIFGSAWYVDASLAHISERLEARVEMSQSKLRDLAVMTDRNSADALTERIVTDCPRRNEFENLLNTLGSASQKDLLSAQNLFESCGSFYAERKALMVSQLEREYEELTNTLNLILEIRDLTVEETALTKWQSLIELERTRSDYLTEQTAIQAEIISLLIEGSKTHPRITELVRQAQSVSESLTVTDAQIDELRLTLI